MQRRKQLALKRLSRIMRGMLLLVLPGWVGCSTMLSAPPVEYQALLQSVETAPDSVTLEIYQLRIPANEPQLAEDIWQAVDEQRLDIEIRRELARNGFQAGVLGGALPDELARQLNLQSEMPEMTAEMIVSGENVSPRVTRRVLQLNRHEPAIIQASDVKDEVYVMVGGEDGIRGNHFEEVEAVYSLRAEPVPGQRVQVRLTPELRHGEMKNRYSGSSDMGMFLVTPSRERESYDQLKLSTALTAGEVLIVSCQASSSGSLGHAFHGIDHNGPAEQKLVLIRLLQIPNSEILADAGNLDY